MEDIYACAPDQSIYILYCILLSIYFIESSTIYFQRNMFRAFPIFIGVGWYHRVVGAGFFVAVCHLLAQECCKLRASNALYTYKDTLGLLSLLIEFGDFFQKPSRVGGHQAYTAYTNDGVIVRHVIKTHQTSSNIFDSQLILQPLMRMC